MHLSYLTRKPQAIFVAGISLFGAMPAAAAPWPLTAATSAQAGANPAVTGGPVYDANYVSLVTNDSDAMSQASASSFGNSVGPYGAGGNGSGVFDSQGQFQRRWDVTNNTGGAQNYSFNFFIYYGSLQANAAGAGGSGYAEYIVNIVRDGSTSLFNSAAKIDSNAILTTSGTTLTGASQSGTYYSWGGTNFTIDLGTLNPGQSTFVEYDLIGHSFGNYDFTGTCGGGYGYGDGVFLTDVGAAAGCTGSSYAFLGDPDSQNSTPIPGIGITATGVSEPAPLGLLGIGLAALAGLRRRVRK